MKLKIEDLKKAISWCEANSRDLLVTVELNPDGRNLSIKTQDRYDVLVDIKLFNDGNMGPTIKKEEALK